MTWTAILTVAIGAYLFKVIGVAIGTSQQNRPGIKSETRSDTKSDTEGFGIFDRLGQLIPPAVLFGLVTSQTVSSGATLVADARLVGVGVGVIAAWRQAPFWFVLVVAAGAAAAIRWFTGTA